MLTRVVGVRTPERAVLDVVFLHGLNGDARHSWSRKGEDGFWPEWLADAVPEAAVWSVDYDAWSSGYRGYAMSLEDRAVNVLATLKARGISERPFVFVTHSMGGLIVKEALLDAAEGDTEFAAFAEAVRGVVFLGTPHNGSGLTKAVAALGKIYRGTAAVKDLERNSAHLRKIATRYRNWVHDTASGVRHLVFFETRPTKGVQVVDEGSADPGLPKVQPVGVDSNHIDICKPVDLEDMVYLRVLGLVKDIVASLNATPGPAEYPPNPVDHTRLAESVTPPEIYDYDVRQDGLFPLGVWSPARRLEPSRLLTEAVPADNRPVQSYIDRTALAAAVEARSRIASGATVYLTGFRIDHRESDETQYCRVYQAPSVYPEVLAIEDLRTRRPELFEECDRAIEHDVRDYLSTAVPSSLAVNLVVVSSENDELLCIERSTAVDSAVGWWTIGVFETMKQADPNRPGVSEDLYGLAARGLDEELGLQSRDYNPIQISWIGVYRPILRGHVVAVLKLRISKRELHARVRAAHSGYEHAAIDWLPLRPSLVLAFNQAARKVRSKRVGSTIEIDGRTWIEQSRLAVQEAWRFRNAIEN